MSTTLIDRSIQEEFAEFLGWKPDGSVLGYAEAARINLSDWPMDAWKAEYGQPDPGLSGDRILVFDDSVKATYVMEIEDGGTAYYVQRSTPLNDLCWAWSRASDEDRKEFLSQVSQRD